MLAPCMLCAFAALDEPCIQSNSTRWMELKLPSSVARDDAIRAARSCSEESVAERLSPPPLAQLSPALSICWWPKEAEVSASFHSFSSRAEVARSVWNRDLCTSPLVT